MPAQSDREHKAVKRTDSTYGLEAAVRFDGAVFTLSESISECLAMSHAELTKYLRYVFGRGKVEHGLMVNGLFTTAEELDKMPAGVVR